LTSAVLAVVVHAFVDVNNSSFNVIIAGAADMDDALNGKSLVLIAVRKPDGLVLLLKGD